ncbi:MAG TPA: squalene/phytoene synthase family protein [Alphaproteobacteria bacterium]|nr:squalene/phytoene synthase family protein [Alphaproteobacteria bacterium]
MLIGHAVSRCAVVGERERSILAAMSTAPETRPRSGDEAAPPAAALADVARAGDYDRYLTVLFAPIEARPALLALIALNLELARVRDAVVEPMIGQIRLQWWRDTVGEALAGRPRNHQVLQAIADSRTRLNAGLIEDMIDAREIELGDPPASLDAFERYCAGTSGALAEAMAVALGAKQEAEGAREVGTAFGMIGVLRSVRWQAERGRVLLPGDVLVQSGASLEALRRLRSEPALADAARRIADAARAHLSPTVAKSKAALLLAPLAKVYLRRLGAVNYDLLGADLSLSPLRKQLAVGWAAFTGRF